MSQDEGTRFEHRPVMVEEVLDLLGPVPAGAVLDATLGGGGHARAILLAHPHLRVVGIDRDDAAIDAATETLAPFVAAGRAELHRGRFDQLPAGTSWLTLSGALFDLGVSSPLFDHAGRGFTYRDESAPLDMRMDRRDPTTAETVVNSWDERALASLFHQHGETRFAHRIARAIVAARPLRTTGDLVDAVRRGIPAAARRTGGHPAKRVFQALRVEVNRELEILPGALDAAIDRLVPGGRLVVLAYHSGEDRIVKDRLRSATTGDCVCPPDLPCACGSAERIVARPLTRGARKPSAEEIAANPRAESARLRAVEKLVAAAPS